MKKSILIFLISISLVSRAQDVIPFDSTIIASILEEHNKERRILGIEELIWDESIASYAQEWAYKLAKEDDRIYHRDSDDYGENIAFYSGSGFDPAYGVAIWNEEKEEYRYSAIGQSGSKESMHYTQVIWENTSRLGCGCAIGKSGSYFFVCNYDPPGNYVGQHPYEKN